MEMCLNKSNRPFYSVVTICFNNIKGLKETYKSIRSQTFNSYEWIVIDGGSTDETKEYLENNLDLKCKWISESDSGIYNAMNKGIAIANGEYIIFMNSSDTFADDMVLQKVGDSIVASNMPDFIYGDAFEKTCDNSLILKKSRSHKYLWYGMFAHHQAMIFRRDVIKGLFYRLEFPMAADYAFVVEVLKKSKKIVRLNFPICVFAQNGVSSSKIGQKQGFKDQWIIKRDIVGLNMLTISAVLFLHGFLNYFRRGFPRVYYILRGMRISSDVEKE